MDISKPYEKMLLIDEEEFLNLKNFQYAQEHYDDSTMEADDDGGSTMMTDDNDDDDNDDDDGGGSERGNPPMRYTSSPASPHTPPGSPTQEQHEYYNEEGDLVVNPGGNPRMAPDFKYATAVDLANNNENLRADIAKAVEDLPKAHKLNETYSKETNEMLDIIHETFGAQVSPAQQAKKASVVVSDDEYQDFLKIWHAQQDALARFEEESRSGSDFELQNLYRRIEQSKKQPAYTRYMNEMKYKEDYDMKVQDTQKQHPQSKWIPIKQTAKL